MLKHGKDFFLSYLQNSFFKDNMNLNIIILNLEKYCRICLTVFEFCMLMEIPMSLKDFD